MNTPHPSTVPPTDPKRVRLLMDFPWLRYLPPVAEELVETLMQKEDHYRGSWQRRGGVGAFMMLARKMDRLESIAESHGYDVFDALGQNTGDVLDDVEDLAAYLLLVLAEHRRRTRVEEGEEV